MSDDLVKRFTLTGQFKRMVDAETGIEADYDETEWTPYGQAATALVAKDAEIARLMALSAVLSSDADAARRASANNYERATAQSRLVADRETDCTKLMAALHHETGLREDAEAEIARLRGFINDLIDAAENDRRRAQPKGETP